MEFLRTFHARGNDYELFKNHNTDTFYVGNKGCSGQGLRPAFETDKHRFWFSGYVKNKFRAVFIPETVINSVGSL